MVRTVLPAVAFLAALSTSYLLGSRARTVVAAPGLLLVAVAVSLGPLLTRHGASATISAVAFFVVLLVLAPAGLGVLQRGRRQLAEQVGRRADERATTSGVNAELTEIAAQLRRTLAAGSDQLAGHGKIESREDVVALEQVARSNLERMRETAHGLLADERPAEPPTVTELRGRVDAIVDQSDLGVEGRLARRSLLSPIALDVLLGSVALVLSGATAAQTDSAAGAVLGVGTALPLAVTRRRPFLAAVVSMAALATLTAMSPAHDALSGPASVGLQLILPFVGGMQRPARRAGSLLALCLGVTALLPLLTRGDYPTAETLGAVAVEIGCWAGGFALRRGQNWLHLIVEDVGQHDRLARQEVSRAEAAQRAALARDLHDAVAHSMTIVVLHAAAARRAWDTPPQRKVHLRVLHQTLAETMSELRQLVVRLEGRPTPAEDRGASAASVGELCERATLAGLRVEVRAEEAVTSEAVGELGSRVLQEALTNAARYAPGSEVHVSIARTGASLRVEVLNGPPRDAPLDSLGAGLGLTGLRTRLAQVGGTLCTSPTAHGGFSLCATLPVQSADR